MRSGNNSVCRRSDGRTRSDRCTRGTTTQLDGPRARCHVMYGLHALSAVSGILTSASIVGAFVFGWPSIIAVIINYVTRDRVRGTWLETHWRWQLRSLVCRALAAGRRLVDDHADRHPGGDSGGRQHWTLGALSCDPRLDGPARPAADAGACRLMLRLSAARTDRH